VAQSRSARPHLASGPSVWGPASAEVHRHDQPTTPAPVERATTPSRLTTSSTRACSNDDQHCLRDQLRCLHRLQRMEPLWSPVVATGGNRMQIGLARKPPKQAKSVPVDCDQLPQRAHGKEGGRSAALRAASSYCCSPGRGIGRSRSRYMPLGSRRDDSSRVPADVRLRQFQKYRGVGHRGARMARFPDAGVRRRLVEIEVAAPLDPAHHHRWVFDAPATSHTLDRGLQLRTA
jgi:hypothetical protein